MGTLSKRELVHLHQLLFRIRRGLIERDDASAYDFREYGNHPVRPGSLHKNKDGHVEAIALLCDGFDRCLGDEEHELHVAQ